MDSDDIVTTLQAYPDLETVLVGAHYLHAMWVQPMLKALPRANLELSRYEPIGHLEALLEEFGVERFVYGSWYWRLAMGPHALLPASRGVGRPGTGAGLRR